MNFLEFKRRLMTDPGDRDPEFRAARKKDDAFARAAKKSDEFEEKLKQALDVPIPDKLADDIIFHQSMQPVRQRRSMKRYLAVAAALVFSVVVTSIMWLDSESPQAPESFHQHLAWHWEMDGAAALQASEHAPSDEEHVRHIFSQMGVHLDHELMAQVKLSKFCPTPEGTGVHAVLDAGDGPVTLFYMPQTQVPDAPQSILLPDGMEAWAFNLERGSMALVAEQGRDTPALATEIKRQLYFPPGINL
jgi:hypothetical protein